MPKTIEIDQPGTRIPVETIQLVNLEVGVDLEPTAELIGSVEISNNIKRIPRLDGIFAIWAPPSR